MSPSNPLSIVPSTGRALAARWPALAAWFLAGWIARLLLLRLAGALGNVEALYGLLVLPLAVIARLASYVGMFLTLRESLPTLRTEFEVAGFAARARRIGDTLSASILPFFVIYAAWSLIKADVVDYTRSSLDQIDFDTVVAGKTALSVPLDLVSISVIVGALVLRWLLRRFDARLPRWTAAIGVYLEGLWVLLTLLVLRTVIAQVPDWLSTRRMFAPLVDLIDQLRTSDLARVVLDALGWIAARLGDSVALPLAWLALAGTVYAGALALRRVWRPRAASAVGERWAGLPRWARRAMGFVFGGLSDRWGPIATSGALIGRAGLVPLGVYALLFAVVQSLSGWLQTGVNRLLGPHPLAWWSATDGPIGLVLDLITVTVQLALVAATFDYCLRQAELLPTAAPVDALAEAPISSPEGSSGAPADAAR